MRGSRQAVSACTGPLCLSEGPKRDVSICFWSREHRVEELCPEDTIRCLSTRTHPRCVCGWSERDATASAARKNDCCVLVGLIVIIYFLGYSIAQFVSFVKWVLRKILEREDITKEGTRRCPLPSPDQCAINDAADKAFGDAPYDGVCRQSRGLIFPDCLPENWLFKTHLTPSYRLFSTQDATPVCVASGHQV